MKEQSKKAIQQSLEQEFSLEETSAEVVSEEVVSETEDNEARKVHPRNALNERIFAILGGEVRR